MTKVYKDSNIEWIGDIPREWKTTKLFNLCTIKGRIGWNGLRSDEFKEKSFAYLVTGQDFVSSDINWDRCYQIDKDRYDEDPFIQLSNGDILITKDGTIGKIAKVRNMDKPACLNSGIFVLKQRKETFDQNYLYWYLVSPILLAYNAYINSGGTTIMHLYQNVFERFPLLIPPISDQHKIADYLDSKCKEIDSLIDLQEQMIAQLTDYKQSVISEAVTKGLNPNAELVSSGIEWIGAVPKKWSINKVNRLFGLIGSGTTPNTSDDDAFVGSINWLQSGDINGGIITNASKKISNDTLVKYSVLSVYKAPFIIVAMYGASVGNISISHIDACVNQACCVLSDSKIDFTYAFYAIKSAQRYLIFRAVGGGQPNISQYTLRQLWIPEPPLAEQRAIASYLDSKCNEIDSLIELKQQKIESLKDYKKSVIFEAVTGKTSIE